ncbi:MAG: hypothetical protein WA719_04810 [Thermoplasmata archaeon]
MLAVAIVLVVVLAGAATYLLVDSGTASRSAVVGDGPTFYQALNSVNASVAELEGGPWTISEVYGVASPVPADPGSWGWGEYDRTLASCQAAFNGLTIWNGTIPLFNGTLNSGTAPFWQLVYYSNASQQLLVATDILGALTVYPPIAFSSECAEQSGLGYEPWASSYFWSFEGFPGNTPTMAGDAWNVMARSYVAWLGEPVGELYLFGATYFGSGQPAADQVNFFTCGTPGAVGATPGLAIYGSTDESSYSDNSFNYTLGCTPTSDNWTAIPLDITFSNATLETGTSPSVVGEKFQFRNGIPPNLSPGFNTRGVTSWMISLELTNSSGSALPLAGSDCSTWVPSLGDCEANASGWYAVLVAPDGGWEGSFGASGAGPSWNYPVLPIANNESFAVVVPQSWNISGDTLSVSSTTPDLPLTGSFTIA